MPRRFFAEKRPWSLLKDRILGNYIVPYLRKVNKLGRPILLVDAFAGPGTYADGTDGSPAILIKAAQQCVPGRYRALFVNADRDQHESLVSLMEPQLEAGTVVCIRASAKAVLDQLPASLSTDTVLVYLDPFGIKDFDLQTLEPFLRRQASTELLMTVQAPILHRLASRRARMRHRVNPRVATFHQRLTATFGGTYWRSSLLAKGSAAAREEKLMTAFADHLRSIIPSSYCGWCPVRDSEPGRAKYYFVFWSTHRAAMTLMNDIMLNAYRQHLYERQTDKTLFQGIEPRHLSSPSASLRGVIEAQVRATPGLSRLDVWVEILKSHFREYTQSEYRGAVKDLVNGGRLRYADSKGTGRLNDDSRLYPIA